MSVATAGTPVEVDSAVLAALDFDTPVEVMPPPPPEVVFDASKISVTWMPDTVVTWSGIQPEPLVFDSVKAQVEALKQAPMVTPCRCPMCRGGASTGTMDPTAKRAWTQAMRSRSYPQTRGALMMGGRWCALGVLIAVAMQAGVRLVQTVDPQTGATGWDGQYGQLPTAVMKWAGLSAADPIVAGVPVSFLNDSGQSFDAIADLVERYL